MNTAIEKVRFYAVDSTIFGSSRLTRCHPKVARKNNLQRCEILFPAVTFPPSEHILKVN
jgi:hypothetical protein